jgi:hypothetical protein
MDINYFLFRRRKYNLILSSINYIIESYDEIIDFQESYDIDKEPEGLIVASLKKNKIDERIQIENLIDFCNSHIKVLCRHEFIHDNVDIDPDNSQLITYCNLCDLSEKYCKTL